MSPEIDDAPAAATAQGIEEQVQENTASIGAATGSDKSSPTTAGDERTFDPFAEHPVAALFPLMRDVDKDGFAGLVKGIREVGLLDPIVLDDNVLLDGRNRFLACKEAEVKPRFVQFRDLGLTITPHEYAFGRNFNRRHLTDEQRAVVVARYFEIDAAEVKRLQAEAGKQGGRGHKKNPVQESVQGLHKPKRAERTVDKIAKAAKTSTHKAQQAINLVKHGAPDVVEAVANGQVKLSEAAYRVGLEHVVQQRRSRRPQQADVIDVEASEVAATAEPTLAATPTEIRIKVARRDIVTEPRVIKVKATTETIVQRAVFRTSPVEMTPSPKIPNSPAPEQLDAVDQAATLAGKVAQALETVPVAICALRRLADFCAANDAATTAQAVQANEVGDIRRHVESINIWLGQFVRALPQTEPSSPGRLLQ